MNRFIATAILTASLIASGTACAQSGSVLEGQSTSDRLARDVQDISRVGGDNARGRQSSSEREQRNRARHGETATSNSARNDSGRSSGKPD